VILLAFASVALAASVAYDLPWFTVDGGGGELSGGSFTLAGTVGQAEAGTLSGGAYSLAGGFWASAGPSPYVWLPIILR
jgi:hypothetical protein